MATKVSTSENKVLFGVINWGIGHATRSSVIIDELLSRGIQVDILSNGKALSFLKSRYEERCQYVSGYNFNTPYNNASWRTYLKIGVELLRSYSHDSKLIDSMLNKEGYSLFINDCRPVNSLKLNAKKYLVNHQLTPKWPFLSKMFQNKLNVWQNDFDGVLIPDYPESLLSGSLSVNEHIDSKIFIGALSRISNLPDNRNGQKLLFFGYALSEIEPRVLSELSRKGIEYEFADKHADRVEQQLEAVSWVVSKPGYSSVMELWFLKKPVLLVDVKWHAEQHELFLHHSSLKQFSCADNLSVQEIEQLREGKLVWDDRYNDRKLLTLTLDTILNEYS